jgi:hypothetical protein
VVTIANFMEEGLPARPIFFLDGRRNDSFMKRLGARTRIFAASDVQLQSAAAIRAIVDDDEDDVDTAPRNEGAHPEEPPLHVIDLSDRPDASTKSATKPAATLWTRLRTGSFLHRLGTGSDANACSPSNLVAISRAW